MTQPLISKQWDGQMAHFHNCDSVIDEESENERLEQKPITKSNK
jgi:hypothetical protein